MRIATASPKARRPRRRFGWRRAFYLLVLFSLLLILSLLVLIRVTGLPSQVTLRIQEELRQRGVEVAMAKIYLDPLGGVVARQVSVRQLLGQEEIDFQADRVRFGFNWFSWWRGEPFLQGGTVTRGRLGFLLDADTRVKLEQIGANVEMTEGGLRVVDAEFMLQNFRFQLDGTLNLSGFKPGPPLTEAQKEARAATWRKIEALLADFKGARPVSVRLHFDAAVSDLLHSTERLTIESGGLVWRGVNVRSLLLDIDYAEEKAKLQGTLALERGELNLEADWKNPEKSVEIQFRSNMDLTLLSGAFPEGVAEVLSQTQFPTLPANDGIVELNWSDGFKYRIQTRSEWNNFIVKGTKFKSFYLPLSYDGSRILVPELKIENETGSCTASLFFDGKNQVKGRLSSDLDPTSFKQIFGPKAQPFFDSLDFKNGPKIDATISGTELKPEALKIEGQLDLVDFSYKGVLLQEVKTKFTYWDHKLHLPDLFLKRAEGQASAEVWHDFKNKLVSIKNGQSELMPSEVSIIFGGKLAGYLAPYQFTKAPKVKIDGVVDLDTQAKTSLTVEMNSKEGVTLKFLGKMVTLRNVQSRVVFKGKNLSVIIQPPTQLFEGDITAQIDFSLTEEKPKYLAVVDVTEQNFQSWLETYFGNKDELGGKVTGSIRVQGVLDDNASIKGGGELAVVDGALYQVPIFIGLSQLLNAIIPNLGYAKASNARMSFDLDNGKVLVRKIDIYSVSAALIGSGTYDYIKDDLDMSMRANIRGIIGVVFFPASKLFEYRGTGTLKETKWEPKAF